jgi:hypothetical protein
MYDFGFKGDRVNFCGGAIAWVGDSGYFRIGPSILFLCFISDTAIEVENLSKKYIIGHQKQERYRFLRDVIRENRLY